MSKPSIPTPHIRAAYGDIASSVLMPGDPLRARFIAETYLDNVRLVTDVRNMLGYTGSYRGKDITVMGSGMGMPSIGIYSYELYHFYGVDQIIRTGTAGALADQIRLRDVVIGISASTDSNYAGQFHLPGTIAPTADFSLVLDAVRAGRELGIRTVGGSVLSSDAFYNDDQEALRRWAAMGVLAVEMEAAALYLNAARAGKRALSLLTISDAPLRGESLPAEEREVGFTDMMKIALEIA